MCYNKCMIKEIDRVHNMLFTERFLSDGSEYFEIYIGSEKLCCVDDYEVAVNKWSMLTATMFAVMKCDTLDTSKKWGR